MTGTAIPLDPAAVARLRAWAEGWPALATVASLAGEAHLVGGAVRDLLLGRAPKDADIALAGAVEPLARRLARATGGVRVPLHADPPTERVALAGGRTLDLAAYRGADLIADLRARDFTINAMALPLAVLLDAGPAVLVDPTGGLADLQRRRVRLAGPTALRDDPLRVLRAYRLMAAGWRLSSTTRRRLRRHRRGPRQPARERVAAELQLILAAPHAWTATRAMTRDGVLRHALPDLVSRLSNQRSALSAPTWPALRRLGRARRDLAGLVGLTRAQRLAAALATELAVERPRVALLGWLALALETARARRLDPAGTSALVAALATSLRCGRRETAEALRIAEALAAGDPLALMDQAAAREALGGLGEAAPGAMLLAWALDWREDAGPARERQRLQAALDLYWETVAPLLAAPPLLDGETLMRARGLRPGPAVGRALAGVRRATLRGEIATPEAALRLAGRLLGEGEEPASAREDSH